jgi:anti-anti-sigma regulatory factor
MSFMVTDSDGQAQNVAGFVHDLTEEISAEQERINLQESLIEAQQAMLRELSTPLMPLAEGVIAMPLIGSVDSRRAQEIMETLLEGVAQHQAHTALLDITGVLVVDTQVANALVRTAHATKLLGAQVILTGIRPDVAQTLVTLGADLSGIITQGTLEAGVAYALQQERL